MQGLQIQLLIRLNRYKARPRPLRRIRGGFRPTACGSSTGQLSRYRNTPVTVPSRLVQPFSHASSLITQRDVLHPAVARSTLGNRRVRSSGRHFTEGLVLPVLPSRQLGVESAIQRPMDLLGAEPAVKYARLQHRL